MKFDHPVIPGEYPRWLYHESDPYKQIAVTNREEEAAAFGYRREPLPPALKPPPPASAQDEIQVLKSRYEALRVQMDELAERVAVIVQLLPKPEAPAELEVEKPSRKR